MPNPVLEAARSERAKHQEKLDALLAAPTTEGRSLTETEAADFEKRSAKIVSLDSQIVGLEAHEARTAAAEEAARQTEDPEGRGQPMEIGDGKIVVKRSPLTYDEFNGNSYLRDIAEIASSQFTGRSIEAPRERLSQHAKEVEIEARTNVLVDRHLRGVRADLKRTGAIGDFEKRVNPNTTAGTGGEFVPPIWYETMFAPYLRPTRTFARRVTNMPLPPGIDVINIPKITTGALTAIQSANAAPVASRDIVTTSVSATVNTIAGQEDISMQLLEQSPLALDGVIFDDLNRDYDQQLDQQIIAGTGSNGQHKGLLNVTSSTTNTVNSTSAFSQVCGSTVFHDASTSATQYRSIVAAVNQIETLTFSALPPTAIWVHPRRSNSWAYSAVDSTYRPLFIPAKYGQFNVLGSAESSPVPEGVAGELFGLPVVKDANMPTTMNNKVTTGGTADPIVVLNESVPLLWEGTPRFRALPEILSGTLQIRFQVYCYSAFIPDRMPTALALITGNTGLAVPGF